MKVNRIKFRKLNEKLKSCIEKRLVLIDKLFSSQKLRTRYLFKRLNSTSIRLKINYSLKN